jgi:small subunit ribosomal protein S1
MIYGQALLVALLVSISMDVQAFVTSSRGVRLMHQHQSLSMATTMQAKQGGLDTVKAKSMGRGDLIVDDDDDEFSSYFTAADNEETSPPKAGETVTGTVIEMDDNGALIEIGGKMSGYLPVKEASLIPIKHVNKMLEIGQDLTAEVIGTLRGMPVMSLRSAQLVDAWEKVLKQRASDESFETTVIEVNRGGAVCSVEGLKAFLPGSHFLGVPDESIIGNTIKVKFLDVNEEEGKVVVSQRRALMDAQNIDLTKGEVVSGTVTGLRNYGAFLELDGGVAGLLHISQISYDRVDNLENLFTIGQRAKVMVIEHDKANGRVALSTKTLEPNPGDMLRDMNSVFEKAEETGKKFHERMDNERKAREAAAKDIVAGLGGSIDETSADPLVSVAESIESILASIVSDDVEAPADVTPADVTPADATQE